MQFRPYQILILALLLTAITLQAQNRTDSVTYSINSRFNGGTGTYAPFLSTANQYDRYSFSPNALTVWGTLHKEIKPGKTFDYGFGAELNGNIADDESRLFPGELYIQGKMHFMNMYAGMKREVYGNQDAELSSGGMLWSKNSRAIPKIAIQSNDYVAVPGTRGLVELKGGISHGWLSDDASINRLLLHHKYGYIRLGGAWPVSFNYGVQHSVQWGGRSETYGTMPVTWDNYLRIFTGKSGTSTATIYDQINALGNHIISQNLGFDIRLKPVQVSLYWQNITEDPPVKFITKTPTVEDGLWGASVKLPGFRLLNHLVVEYVSTTDQNGPWHDLDGVIYGGLDGYYRSGTTPNGWSYKGMTIGNPWLSSPRYDENGSVAIDNNVIRLYYFSGKGMIRRFDYRLTLAYSENYGVTSPIYEDCKKQFSWQLETSTSVNRLKNIKLNLGISGDHGTMYGNNIAVLIGFSYSGFWDF